MLVSSIMEGENYGIAPDLSSPRASDMRTWLIEGLGLTMHEDINPSLQTQPFGEDFTDPGNLPSSLQDCTQPDLWWDPSSLFDSGIGDSDFGFISKDSHNTNNGH